MPGSLISVEEARARILATVRPLAPEPVPAEDALGRVLAEDVVSELELPPFDSSAMDGFAVVAGPAAELTIVGESQAGLPFDGELRPGEAVRISTGAVIPRGASAVVPIERVSLTQAGVRVPDSRSGANVRRAGDDVHEGDVVIGAGTELGPAELGMLAALGRATADCARRPRLAVVTTGDELVRPGRALRPGQIYDSNEAALRALADRAGAARGGYEWIADLPDATASALERIADPDRGEDVICIAGGVSVGPHDHVKQALTAIGFEEVFWGVRLKPGKPFWFGARGNQYAFGLPGNPVSAMVTFALFVRPALRALQGADPAAPRSVARLDAPIEANPDRDQAVRCRLRTADDGWHAEPTGPQGSHVMSSMLGAAALAIVPASERELPAGELVTIELL
jgi:molybdopterin molybdotransferase